ncbi:hypothetical protein ACFOWE_31765 [Planomonospora corallina]|uniref:Mobilization protein n=1 Tax=Planomonospora corallina TaxID=1806052 RepID=A0ABV8II57_9ACTN
MVAETLEQVSTLGYPKPFFPRSAGRRRRTNLSTPPTPSRTCRRSRTEAGHRTIRTIRVNLRLSAEEHAELARAAAGHGQTVAGYAAAVALTVARDDLPPDLQAGYVRLMRLETLLRQTRGDLARLLHHDDQGPSPAEVLAALTATLKTVEDAVDEHIRPMRSEWNRRTNRGRRRRRAAVRQQPPADEPGVEQHANEKSR